MCAACGHTHFGAASPLVDEPRLLMEGPRGIVRLRGPDGQPLPAPAPPPQPRRYGKVRPFWKCILFGLLTAGLYFVFYQWQAFREVDEHSRQRHLGAIMAVGMLASLVVRFLQALQPRAPGESALDLPTTTATLALWLLGQAALSLYVVLELQHVKSWLATLAGAPGAAVAAQGLIFAKLAAAFATLAFAASPFILAALVALVIILELLSWVFIVNSLNDGWDRAKAQGLDQAALPIHVASGPSSLQSP